VDVEQTYRKLYVQNIYLYIYCKEKSHKKLEEIRVVYASLPKAPSPEALKN
jgi:hypothetical protein